MKYKAQTKQVIHVAAMLAGLFFICAVFTSCDDVVCKGTNGKDTVYFGCNAAGDRLVIILNGKSETHVMKDCDLIIRGGAGDDLIEAVSETTKENVEFGKISGLNFRSIRLLGESGHDTIIGTPLGDIISGGEGNDLLDGKKGDDFIYGNQGDDHIIGNYGKDSLWGGSGKDFILGSFDNDTLFGGPGDDFLFGDKANDHLYGGSGCDTLLGCTGEDTIDGGPGRDHVVCRTTDHARIEYDYGNCFEDCNYKAVNVERFTRSDPYTEWAYMYANKIVTGRSFTVTYFTTGNGDLLLDDRAAGATILTRSDGEPLRTIHKQYGGSCGPSSLAIVMEHLGLTDPHQRLHYSRDLNLPAVPVEVNVNDPERLKEVVDVGYKLSPEHIMFEGYHRAKAISNASNGTWPPKNEDFTIDGNLLNTEDFEPEDDEVWDERNGEFYEIKYPIGNVVEEPPQSQTYKGKVQKWTVHGRAVGIRAFKDQSYGLPFVANKFTPCNKDACPISADFTKGYIKNLAHLKAVYKGFIDHNIPLVIAVDNSKHFNTLIGYWDTRDVFYIYTAEPLDGWGRSFPTKPMRWRKIPLTESTLKSGAVGCMILFGHSGQGCGENGWAKGIDNNFEIDTLCGYLKMHEGYGRYTLKAGDRVIVENETYVLCRSGDTWLIGDRILRRGALHERRPWLYVHQIKTNEIDITFDQGKGSYPLYTGVDRIISNVFKTWPLSKERSTVFLFCADLYLISHRWSNKGVFFDLISRSGTSLWELARGDIYVAGNGSEVTIEEIGATVKLVRGMVTITRTNMTGQGYNEGDILLTTHWAQGGNYNDKLPNDANGKQCGLGCWTVAIGQILRYHELQSYGTVGYDTEIIISGTPLHVHTNLNANTYYWSKMPDQLTGNSTPEEKEQVAMVSTFLRDVALVIGKQFPTHYLGGSTIRLNGVKNHFCHISAKSYEKNFPDSAGKTPEAINTIIEEINNNRPIMLYVEPLAGGGHAVVIDGYQQTTENGYDIFRVHLNLGWGGSGDGWYDYSKDGKALPFNLGNTLYDKLDCRWMLFFHLE